MRSHPEVALTDSDEVGNVQNHAGRQVVQLAPVKEQEPAHEAVQREPESMTEELLVQHSLAADRHRHGLCYSVTEIDLSTTKSSR